jgi:hypothetical protein
MRISKTPTYYCWLNMKKRCLRDGGPDYPDYGGRGITFDPRWRTFAAFFKDMGEKPEGKTLDRKNNDGPYCKKNCRWATPLEQSENKRNNIRVTIEGETHSLTWWARHYGVNPTLAWIRVHRLGWSKRRAVSTIPIPRKKKPALDIDKKRVRTYNPPR